MVNQLYDQRESELKKYDLRIEHHFPYHLEYFLHQQRYLYIFEMK